MGELLNQDNHQEKYQYIKKELVEIFTRTHPPKLDKYLDVVRRANQVLISEDNKIRPYDKSNLPGGIVILNRDLPTIIISDIHARMEYIISILFTEDLLGETILEKLSLGLLQIACVGDGMHAESRAAKRWAAAFDEYKNDFEKHENMDQEMRESFGVMEMIMQLKINFPNHFHFLKGNHENISNEKGAGNHSFAKYAHEGPMVAHYVKKFYGEELFNQYYQFEKNLPIFGIGKNFLISHAEPGKVFTSEEIIDYRNNPEVVLGFTWTDDDAAEDGSVERMLQAYIHPDHHKDSFYFGGHRPIEGLFNPRAKGKYIQLHNPKKFVVAIIKKGKKIKLEKDIIEITKKIKLVDDPSTANVNIEKKVRTSTVIRPTPNLEKVNENVDANEDIAASADAEDSNLNVTVAAEVGVIVEPEDLNTYNNLDEALDLEPQKNLRTTTIINSNVSQVVNENENENTIN